MRPLPSLTSREARDHLVRLRCSLDAWVNRTGDPRVKELERRFAVLAPALWALDDELQAEDRETVECHDFRAMTEGRIPFPNETLAAFTPQCSCTHACPVCTGLAAQYEDETGDCAGPAEHTCLVECPVHGDG